MEHLETVLERMGEDYQNFAPALHSKTFHRVLLATQRKKQRRRSIKALGITACILTLFLALLFSTFIPLARMGGFYSVYYYLSYAFAFMSLIVFIAINNQKFFKKILGKFLMEKMTFEECDFVYENVD
ncbi:MAG: hypothetical protein CVV50_01350 [Spirochaetae bacterium HGW-Spirochaetae-6]|nr:MAG: hypothetical protein CVV50_01350 [Spirochaetae bacterium HGW-Spirochaetae-6]